MNNKKYTFYRAELANSEKYVKTNGRNTQIINLSAGSGVVKSYNKPYPFWEGEEFTEVTRAEYIQALKKAGYPKNEREIIREKIQIDESL